LAFYFHILSQSVCILFNCTANRNTEYSTVTYPCVEQLTHCIHTFKVITLNYSIKSKTKKKIIESKFFSVHTMKVYRGSRGIALLFLNLGTRWSSVVNFMFRLIYLRERTLVLMEEERIFFPKGGSKPGSSNQNSLTTSSLKDTLPVGFRTSRQGDSALQELGCDLNHKGMFNKST